MHPRRNYLPARSGHERHFLILDSASEKQHVPRRDLEVRGLVRGTEVERFS
jgi:hypothetical protein